MFSPPPQRVLAYDANCNVPFWLLNSRLFCLWPPPLRLLNCFWPLPLRCLWPLALRLLDCLGSLWLPSLRCS